MIIFKKLFFLFLFILVLFLFTINASFAEENDARIKGFSTNNLTYKSDKSVTDQEIRTSKYKYGCVFMWAANYEWLCNESNGNKTLYVIYFIESSIDSVGKNKKNYFRNKELKVETNFYSNKKIDTINYTETTNNSTSSYSKSLGFSGNASAGENSSIGVEGSFSITNTETYDTVSFTQHSESTDNSNYHFFSYFFNKYSDGEMRSPHIGLVKERLFIVFKISDYDSNTSYSMDIKTTAFIFKDATWPKGNYTLDGSIDFKFINGQAM